MAFPDGLAGDVVLSGRGRDLLTRADGSAEVVDVAAFEATVDFAHGQRVTGSRPRRRSTGVDVLVGRGAGGRFRKHLNQVVEDHDLVGSLQFLLLDDLSGASLVSGYAPQLAIAHRDADPRRATRFAQPADATQIMSAMSDVCAGGGREERS